MWFMTICKVKTTVFALLLAAQLAVPAQAHENYTHAPAPFNSATVMQTVFGIAGDPKAVKRTIKVTMDDSMRFTPNALMIKEGETVRLLVTNHGKMLHEIVLGTADALHDHAEMMKQHPGMEHHE